MAGRGLASGQNSRPLDDTVAETGPGIADDAVVGGELAPGELGVGADMAVEKLERSGWVEPTASAAEAETQAHPS